MMRACLLAILAAMPVRAAVIRGSVVENFTGKLLARALVTLEPMEGTSGDVRTMRTTTLGGFEFDGLGAGAYIVKAARRGFIPAEFGQKRWNSAGQPVLLEEAATTFLLIRLPRFSAVSGTVVDENEIGLPSHEVSVYRATQPPELIAEGVTDDRGIYRLGGLTPGKYVVRTLGKQYEEGGYLPTFSRETDRLDQAQVADLFLEQQTSGLDVRPLPGQLYTLAVDVETDPPGMEVTLTLASPMGRKTVKAGSFRFTGLQRDEYEVYSEATGDPRAPAVIQGSYQRLLLGENTHVSLLPLPGIGVTVTGGPENSGELRVRRKDLAGLGPVWMAPIPRGRAMIHAGRWEVMLKPPSGYYVSSALAPGRERTDGWHEVQPRSPFGTRFSLSGSPGGIRGVVKDGPYAPVCLEPYDPATRRRAGDLQVTRADARGYYHFGNLAPGSYRLLATFEYLLPDVETMDNALAPSVLVDAHAELARDLDLWVIR